MSLMKDERVELILLTDHGNCSCRQITECSHACHHKEQLGRCFRKKNSKTQVTYCTILANSHSLLMREGGFGDGGVPEVRTFVK